MPRSNSEGSIVGSWKASNSRRSSKNAGPYGSITPGGKTRDEKATPTGRSVRTPSVKKASVRPSSGSFSLPQLERPPALARAAVAALSRNLLSGATGSRTPSSTSYHAKRTDSSRRRSELLSSSKKKKQSDVGSAGLASGRLNAGESTRLRSVSSLRPRKPPSGLSASKRKTTKRRPSSKGALTSESARRGRAGRAGGKDARMSSSRRHLSLSMRRRSGASSPPNSTRQPCAAPAEAPEAALPAEEEPGGEVDTPVSNALVLSTVREYAEQISEQQRMLRDTFDKFWSAGAPGGRDVDINAALGKLRSAMGDDVVAELYRLRAEKASLCEQLEAKRLEMELKTADLETLRHDTICMVAQKVSRVDVDTDNLKTKAERVLAEATLDVAKMKKELMNRIDIASAHFRKPQYGTALRSIKVLAEQTQKEIQHHHDILTDLIMSIEARSNLAKFVSATMHSNIPAEYRTKLRQMNKDRLLNILDVLSFQEGAVDCIGKALYALEETEHKTVVN